MRKFWPSSQCGSGSRPRRRSLAVGGALYALVHHHHEADFRPLFTGVAPEDASAIVQKLKGGGVEYRVPDEGGMVLVPSARVAELRINMAAAGLPKTGRIGFELFESTNLGATEFTEHINYRRAIEGELERSVMSLAEVEQARVHVTFPKDSVFLESQEPAKASVLVKLRPGSRLAPQNVQAIDHLVSAAVEGLSPDAVSVLDMNGNLLGRPKPTGGLDGPEPSEAALEYRHHVEADLLYKDELHPRAAARRREIPCERFRRLRFYGRRAERGNLRPGAFRHEQFAADRRRERGSGGERRSGNGFHPAASHFAAGRRLEPDFADHRKRGVSIQPNGEEDAYARRKRQEDVARGAGGSIGNLAKQRKIGGAGARSAIG